MAIHCRAAKNSLRGTKALQTYCMMLPLNLNPQLYATSALWANDSTMENIMQAYSEI
jgi:hypothetical protein